MPLDQTERDSFEGLLAMPPRDSEQLGQDIFRVLGRMEEALVALREDVADAKADMKEDRAATARVSADMLIQRNAFINLESRLTELDRKLEALRVGVEPLIEWRRSGIRVLSGLTAAGVVVYWVFGPVIQDLARRFINWLFH